MEFSNPKRALKYAKETGRKVERCYRIKVDGKTGQEYRCYYYRVI